jgi:hypothetical protein
MVSIVELLDEKILQFKTKFDFLRQIPDDC